jgi:uncharacterized protein
MKILNFPEVTQSYEYDCGSTALQAVLTYYGKEEHGGKLIKLIKTSKRRGTKLLKILEALKKYDLKFDSKTMTIEELKNYIDQKIPIIILIQAWRIKDIPYTNNYDNGHWVIVIGYDEEKIYFEDPYVFKRTFLTTSELEDRWHGKEGNKIIKHGVAIYGKEPVYNPGEIIHMD